MSNLNAILHQKCPRCHKGNLFKHGSYSGLKMTEMNKTCEVCNTSFVIEPGFYQGALYVSYAFNIALLVIIGITVNLFVDKPSIWLYIGAVTVSVLLLFPLIYRYSRTLYLYWFGGLKYQEHHVKNKVELP